MTALAATALAFAREILRWEDAREYASGWLDNGTGGGSPVFPYTDLDTVLEAVTAWWDANKARLDVYYRADGYGAHVWFPSRISEQNLRPTHTGKSLHAPLMAACLEASRNLRA